ncbi:hypothetical protein CHUV2995_01071 [Corynebacterium diphtheriae subsp. lausannense]|nr:hypothetical protein BUE64_03810 [Corynebacterium diphtheriae subsp. lausannense]OWM38456.1 hypothetical protein AZF07_04675 [Corynebacterium diphtheriae subsp. lausannense]SNW32161.1 hypothetical protein FRC0043_01797 [Corynebacterium belfantii]SPJ40279.1 hypothetical protein CHUV2995_01071 [Corynebacterium diphtheriae subsp. lausannense]STC66334.1 Uncharacterised protein [Corynebacterium diphtheriae]
MKYLYIKVWVTCFLLGGGGLDFLKGVVGCTICQVAYTYYSVGEHRETQLEHDLHRDVENRLEVSILREIERV